MMQSTTLWFSLLVSWYIAILPAVDSKRVIVEGGNQLIKRFTKNKQFAGVGDLWELQPSTAKLYTCGAGNETEFWMMTTYFPLNTTFAEVIYVDVEAEFTICKHPAYKKRDGPCYASYFEIFAYRGTEDDAKYSILRNELNAILNIYSPLYNITNNTDFAIGTKTTRTNQTFSFSRNNSEGIVFAIRSKGACGSIYRMKMYYYYCEEKFINGIIFEKTASLAAGSKAVVKGHCTGNTIPPGNSKSLDGNCTYNGTWNIEDNVTCTCDENYTLNQDIGICLPLLVSNKKPNLTRIAHGEFNITWIELNIKDESILSSYYVRCLICNSNASVCSSSCKNEIYHPRQKNLTETRVTVSNLAAGETYVFRVYVKYHFNGKVSEEEWRYLETDPVQLGKEG